MIPAENEAESSALKEKLQNPPKIFLEEPEGMMARTGNRF